ncbi:MAG: hypothetical protein PVJ80_03120 [Gemmatimonadota bacterium]|jgi:hypothetical protein
MNSSHPRAARSIHKRITLGLQVVLLVGLVLSALQGQWDTAISVFAIVLVTLAPVALGRRFHVFIPPEFEVLAIVFVFASLFLGEIRDYYTRFWWWDAVLHTASGFLLGILGFLLVHVLNEKEEIELHMRPAFVAFFAFVFAVGIGAIWEIFEFGMDQLFGLNMQKSGLVDTMWDMIVNTIGAATIAVMGYGYLKTAGNESFLEKWIDGFIESNPRMFGDDEDGEIPE